MTAKRADGRTTSELRGGKGKKRNYPKTRKPCGRKKRMVPTMSERQFVAAMAGINMTTKEIAAVIGAGRNTVEGGPIGKPLSPKTLYRYFRKELEGGPALLRATITGRYYDALKRGEAWAIQHGLRNKFNWDVGKSGFDGVSLAQLEGTSSTPLAAQITFHVPTNKQTEEVPAPRHEPAPRPWQKALPSPPRLRVNNFGLLEPDED